MTLKNQFVHYLLSHYVHLDCAYFGMLITHLLALLCSLIFIYLYDEKLIDMIQLLENKYI